jgi:DNA-binding CsgD family transcriptional regulator
MIRVVGEPALSDFRRRLTGRYGLDLVRQHGGRVLVQWAVGVGKSSFLDAITVEAVTSRAYDSVVVLAPTRQALEERSPLVNPPAGVKVVNLRPRPARRCGKERDAAWKKFEVGDLGVLGRMQICAACPHRRGCFWPDQYGKAIEGARIVYGTHAHIERSPGFLEFLSAKVGASKVLTLVDECNFAGKNFDRVVTAHELRRFHDTLRTASFRCTDPAWSHSQWMQCVEMLRDASTEDLQDPGWIVPVVNYLWAQAIQREGWQQHREEFRFLAYRLAEFAASPQETRYKDDAGNLRFARRPYLGDYIVFTATANLQFAQFRLGHDLASPFSEYQFSHPDTRWFNIASPIGARRNFPQHAPQVLDFFAELIARRLAEDKRVLLVAKKCLVPLCACGLTERFAARGLDIEIVTAKWGAAGLDDPRTVPLISYGMIGTNLFEDFDCCFCLTSYYINESVLNTCLQDMTPTDLRLPIRIETVGSPKRRRAGVADPAHRYYDTNWLAQPTLEFLEHGVVQQAVGRVRPVTRSREVITLQMAELPGVTYDQEFRSLGEARPYFGVPSRRERQTTERASQIRALRSAGNTQAETARILGVSVKTIWNYERQEDRKNSI